VGDGQSQNLFLLWIRQPFITLSDVVVATPTKNNSSVLGYDMVKVEPEQTILMQWQNAPNRHIHSAITNIWGCQETTARFMSNLNRFRSISFP
jgi:hypothetical protein